MLSAVRPLLSKGAPMILDGVDIVLIWLSVIGASLIAALIFHGAGL